MAISMEVFLMKRNRFYAWVRTIHAHAQLFFGTEVPLKKRVFARQVSEDAMCIAPAAQLSLFTKNALLPKWIRSAMEWISVLTRLLGVAQDYQGDDPFNSKV